MSDFIHLHTHTQQSLLDGMIQLEELPKHSKDLGMSACSITDHGSLAGSYEFNKQCKKVGIKPIIGIESYFSENRTLREKDELDNNYYHLILLAQNQTGLTNLFRMNSIAWEDGLYHKGRIDDSLLEQYNEGIICTSACLGGRIAQLFNKGNRKQAEDKILYYKELFKDRFFLEVQVHEIPEQWELNKFLLEVSSKYNIPPIFTCDCHYLKREDGVDKDSPHELLLGVQTGKTIDDPKKFSFDQREHWVKSPQEVEATLKKAGLTLDLMSNTLHIGNMCSGEYFLEKKNHMPKLPNIDAGKELERKAKWGLVRRFGSIEKVPQNYRERLTTELDTIKQLGYPDYFLMVEDFVTWARNNNASPGPGRGSVAGSLVAWALGLTSKACDPITSGLFFERFLNASRVSPPDVDQDIAASKRDKVKDYVRNKYGKDYTASIGTYGYFYPRSAVRDMARVYGHDTEFVNEIAALVPDNFRGIAPTIEECESTSPSLLTDPKYSTIWNKAKRIIGLPRNAGSHAAGVIIATDSPLRDNMPLYRRSDSEDMITEFDMKEVEELGYFKFDFLGLKNLDVVDTCLSLIKKRHGLTLDLDQIDYEDKETFDLICSGKLCGIFQLDGSLRSIVLRVQPSTLEDISAVNALGRPGPIDAGLVDKFVDNKRNHTMSTGYPKDIDQAIGSTLSTTYGVYAYQEQVMKIAQIVCGFTLQEADNLRRAIGKKNREAMAKLEDSFISGAVNRGFGKDGIEQLWKDIVGFADYSFNKAHSWAYSVLSYQEAWLKTHYPAEFMCALMTHEEDLNNISSYIAECKLLGLEVLSPGIGTSEPGFSFTKSGSIVFGLGSIKGLGSAAIKSILSARNGRGFKSFEDFIERIDGKKLNRKAIESLVYAGAFDEMGYDRQTLLDSLDKTLGYYDAISAYHERVSQCAQRDLEVEAAKKEIDIIDKELELIPHKGKTAKDPLQQQQLELLKTKRGHLSRLRPLKRPELPTQERIPCTPSGRQITLELLTKEKEMLGYYVSMHPTDFISGSGDTSYINEISPGSTGIANGVVLSVKEWKSKSGKMAFLNIEDATGIADVTVFASLYKKLGSLTPGQIVRVMYRAEDNDSSPRKLIADKLRIVQQDVTQQEAA